MPHADSSLVPAEITTKAEFYEHIREQLEALLTERFWVSNLAQVASLLYHSYAGTPLYGTSEAGVPVVNWAGFYVRERDAGPLVLGPFHGRPACGIIRTERGKGVCADAFVGDETVVVQDVDAYPGHIACDGDTKSEIVLPLRFRTVDGVKTVGVLDLDSTVLSTFDDEDRKGLEGITALLLDVCDWP